LDIFKAVEQGRLVRVRKLPAAGVDVNARFPAASQQMLLHAAAWNGDLPIAKLLVAKGADRRALEPASSSTQSCRT
jgi:ankyrin repeat protein